MPTATLPPVLHERISTPSTEWAKKTHQALEGQPSSRSRTFSSGGDAIPGYSSPTTTPGVDIPGSYPRSAATGDPGEDLRPAELVNKAKEYLPDQEQVLRAMQTASTTAAQFLHPIVASISPYLPAATVSENNTTHAKAAPSQGVMSPRPVDSVGAASELTGTPHGPHPYVETPLAQHPDIALPQIGGGAHLPPEAQQASAAAPRYTAMAPVDPARTASLEAPGRPIVAPSTTFGKPFKATSSAALETHEIPSTAVSSASAHGSLSSGDRTMPGLSAVSSRTPPPLSQDASSPGHNAGFLAGPQSPHDRAVSTSFAGESATRIEPRAGPLPADPGLNGSTTSSGSTKIVVVPGAPSLPSKDLAASRDGMQMGDQPVADADDRFIVAKDLESSAGGVPHEPVPRATAMHDSHVDNGTEGAFGIGPGIMKTSSVVTSFKASEGITPSRFRSEDKDDVGTTSVGSSAPGSGSGDALPMVSSYAGNVPDDRLGRVPVKFGLGGPANDEARVRAHGTDAGGGGHAPCGREEDGQRGGANGALPGAGEGAAVGMGASTMRTQAHDHDGQPPTDSQRREGGRSMGLLPTSQTEAPRDVGEEETSLGMTPVLPSQLAAVPSFEQTLAMKDPSLNVGRMKSSDSEGGMAEIGRKDAQASPAGDQPKAPTTGGQPQAQKDAQSDLKHLNRVLATADAAGVGGVAGLGVHRLRDDARERCSSQAMRDQVDNAIHGIGTTGGIPDASGSIATVSRSPERPHQAGMEKDQVSILQKAETTDGNTPSNLPPPAGTTQRSSQADDRPDPTADAGQGTPRVEGEKSTKSTQGAHVDKGPPQVNLAPREWTQWPGVDAGTAPCDEEMANKDAEGDSERPIELQTPLRAAPGGRWPSSVDGQAQVKNDTAKDAGRSVGAVSGREGKGHAPSHSTDSASSKASGKRRSTFMERVKGEAKIISGKLGGDIAKVEEGRRMKSGGL